ncbi:hypothetical protein KCP77_19865 [Salmonella enterica subsp. enterica]|nr:hypothetical protein KCP77_19865 [Salmonella enterica subsp. enterica]
MIASYFAGRAEGVSTLVDSLVMGWWYLRLSHVDEISWQLTLLALLPMPWDYGAG